MAKRLAGAVRISLPDHRSFLERLHSIGEDREPGAVTTSITRSVTGDQIIYSTTCIQTVGEVGMLATTTTRFDQTDDTPDADGEALLLVGLETQLDRPSPLDVLRAAGLPPKAAKDLVTGMPARVTSPANRPQFPWQFEQGLEGWLARRAPSVTLLVGTDDAPGRETLKAAERAVPWAMRNAVSILAVRPHLAEECDSFLAAHDLAPLRGETICVLRMTNAGLVEHYRSPALDRNGAAHREAARLAAVVTDGFHQTAGELTAYLTTATIAGLGHDPEAEARDLTKELNTARAEVAQTRDALARAERSLTAAQRRIRELEHAAALAEAAAEDINRPPEAEQSPPEQPTARPPTPAPPAPEPAREFSSFKDVLAAARNELELVHIGDVDREACELDAHRKADIWRSRAWSTLVMMQRYAEHRATESTTAFRQWLEEHPRPLIGPEAIAPAETAFTASTPDFRRARTFPVATEVDPSGHAYFGAHVRIEPGSTSPAPRLHYLDACSTTGKMYVGYLGKHLPTRRGN